MPAGSRAEYQLVDAKSTSHLAADEDHEHDLERTAGSGSRLFRSFERIGDPSAWNDPSKCIFVAVICLTATLWYTALWLYTIRNPEFGPMSSSPKTSPAN